MVLNGAFGFTNYKIQGDKIKMDAIQCACTLPILSR
jgi:hypothetical protein